MTEQNNLFHKINQVKTAIAKANLKKSWENGFAHFTYYELGDFLPFLIEQCEQVGIFNHITFGEWEAVLEIINCENPTQTIKYSVPTCDIELKWCNRIQALGWMQTYSRRYLYITAYDICESDSFDAVTGDWNKNEEKHPTTKEKEKMLNDFKAKCEKLDTENKEEVKKILDEWRKLLWSLDGDAKQEICDLCVGIKEMAQL